MTRPLGDFIRMAGPRMSEHDKRELDWGVYNCLRDQNVPSELASNITTVILDWARTHDVRTMTNKQIRHALGHNGVECKVRITHDGTVRRYGSPDPTDRSKDFWQFMGHVSDFKEQDQ